MRYVVFFFFFPQEEICQDVKIKHRSLLAECLVRRNEDAVYISPRASSRESWRGDGAGGFCACPVRREAEERPVIKSLQWEGYRDMLIKARVHRRDGRRRVDSAAMRAGGNELRCPGKEEQARFTGGR